MNEIVLDKKKNGMLMLFLIIILFIGSITLCVFACIDRNAFILILSVIMMVVSICMMPGLKVLKPQEALVLTLFGKYIGL